MVSMFLCVHVHSRFFQSASACATFCSSQEAQTPTQFGIQPSDELSNTSAALNASLSRVTEPLVFRGVLKLADPDPVAPPPPRLSKHRGWRCSSPLLRSFLSDHI